MRQGTVTVGFIAATPRSDKASRKNYIKILTRWIRSKSFQIANPESRAMPTCTQQMGRIGLNFEVLSIYVMMGRRVHRLQLF